MNKAIVVLTRGYDNIEDYNSLINRNIFIEEHLDDKSTDILIFHEGNITVDQQSYIKSFSPELRIIFIDIKIDNKAFLESKKNCEFKVGLNWFNLGYRHMCHFWFVDFWHFCNDYDYILRIDEDCEIYFDVADIFNLLQDKIAVYGGYDVDSEGVTVGLNDFTIDFLKKNVENIDHIHSKPSGPFTNLMGFNLKMLRENHNVIKYIEEIDKSDNIYIYRWGDGPLWGEILKYLYTDDMQVLTKDIKYLHGSHNNMINI